MYVYNWSKRKRRRCCFPVRDYKKKSSFFSNRKRTRLPPVPFRIVHKCCLDDVNSTRIIYITRETGSRVRGIVRVMIGDRFWKRKITAKREKRLASFRRKVCKKTTTPKNDLNGLGKRVMDSARRVRRMKSDDIPTRLFICTYKVYVRISWRQKYFSAKLYGYLKTAVFTGKRAGKKNKNNTRFDRRYDFRRWLNSFAKVARRQVGINRIRYSTATIIVFVGRIALNF